MSIAPTEQKPQQAANRKYILILAAIAVVILAIGSILRPSRQLREVVTISAAERERLQRMTQRRNLQEMTTYFAQLAAGVAPQVLRLKETQATGIVWDGGGTIVTSAPETYLPEMDTVVGTEPDVKLTPAVHLPGLPVATLQAPASTTLVPVRRAPPDQVLPGSWILVVGRRSDGNYLYIPVLFTGLERVSCGGTAFQEVGTSVPLNRELAGSGVFDESGGLIGLVVDCADRVIAVAPMGVSAAILSARTAEGQILGRYGFRVSVMSELAGEVFGTTQALLVTEVWDEWPAGRAGIAPGDLIVRVGTTPAAGTEAIRKLASVPAGEPLQMTVARGRQTRTIQLPPPESSFQLVLDRTASGYLVQEIGASSPPARAGLAPGDRILSAIPAPAGSGPNALESAIANPSVPTFVVFRRGGRQIGSFVQ